MNVEISNFRYDTTSSHTMMMEHSRSSLSHLIENGFVVHRYSSSTNTKTVTSSPLTEEERSSGGDGGSQSVFREKVKEIERGLLQQLLQYDKQQQQGGDSPVKDDNAASFTTVEDSNHSWKSLFHKLCHSSFRIMSQGISAEDTPSLAHEDFFTHFEALQEALLPPSSPISTSFLPYIPLLLFTFYQMEKHEQLKILRDAMAIDRYLTNGIGVMNLLHGLSFLEQRHMISHRTSHADTMDSENDLLTKNIRYQDRYIHFIKLFLILYPKDIVIRSLVLDLINVEDHGDNDSQNSVMHQFPLSFLSSTKEILHRFYSLFYQVLHLFFNEPDCLVQALPILHDLSDHYVSGFSLIHEYLCLCYLLVGERESAQVIRERLSFLPTALSESQYSCYWYSMIDFCLQLTPSSLTNNSESSSLILYHDDGFDFFASMYQLLMLKEDEKQRQGERGGQGDRENERLCMLLCEVLQACLHCLVKRDLERLPMMTLLCQYLCNNNADLVQSFRNTKNTHSNNQEENDREGGRDRDSDGDNEEEKYVADMLRLIDDILAQLEILISSQSPSQEAENVVAVDKPFSFILIPFYLQESIPVVTFKVLIVTMRSNLVVVRKSICLL